MKLFDSHCHLQDPRIYDISTQKIKMALDAGVVHIAVNGVSEKDWQLVKEMSENNPCVIPNFGLHPWFILDRTPNWLNILKEFLECNPEAAVGEIGLDKAPWASHIDYKAQVEVFHKQLQLAKELNRPASIHCVEAFDDLIEILKSLRPFPTGFLLHSYTGSHELVPELANLGAYFSISGHLMPMEESKAKKILQSIPLERILLETDAPDALPKSINSGSILPVAAEETLNHPANIHHVLAYVARLLEMDKEELAQISYENARRIFSYEEECMQHRKRTIMVIASVALEPTSKEESMGGSEDAIAQAEIQLHQQEKLPDQMILTTRMRRKYAERDSLPN